MRLYTFAYVFYRNYAEGRSIFLDYLFINVMICIIHTCEGLNVAKVLKNIHHKFVEAI